MWIHSKSYRDVRKQHATDTNTKLAPQNKGQLRATLRTSKISKTNVWRHGRLHTAIG